MTINIDRARQCAEQLRTFMPQRVTDPDIHAVQDLVALVDELFASPAVDDAIAKLVALKPAPEPEVAPEPDTKPSKSKSH